MVNKSNILICLNLLGFTIILVLLIQINASTEWLIVIFTIALILFLLDYLILRGADKIVKAIQYRIQKTFTCPKCYTKVEKREHVLWPNCGSKI